MRPFRIVCACLLVAVGALWLTAFADETSTGDKLRILYSNRFTFTDHGAPLVTIELLSGQSSVTLWSEHGVLVRPDGDGGSQVDAGARWSVHVENAKPAPIREWTVVESLDPDDDRGMARASKLWQGRGYAPRLFEVGTIFGVDGEVIDSRQTLLAVAPVRAGFGGQKSSEIANKYNIQTHVHQQLVQRPEGIIVAQSGNTIIRNPSVLWFAPKVSSDTLTLADVIAGGGGSQLQVKRENRRYFGSIYVTLGSDGKLVAVNAVPADTLLSGLVPAEIYPDAAANALAAQAIAARTELLEKIGTRHLTDPYLLCSSQHCQVYSGAGKEHPRTSRAVARTRGQVLLREGGGLVDARYSASCGGHGEHNEHIWGGDPDPSLRGHLDMSDNSTVARRFAGGIDNTNIKAFLELPSESSYCGTTRYSKDRFRWNRRLSAAEINRLVAAHYPQVGSVRTLEPLERGISGRIKKLRIQGSKGSVVAAGDLHIRRLLGGLRSSLFVVHPLGGRSAPSAFEFRGAGFGHGVGMCQIGAIGMAESGSTYNAILRHYYPGSRIKRLY